MKKFVVVAGNIGVGKSTLVRLLCERLDWKPYYEPVAENPYLADFYADMPAWAFHSQIFFLVHRLRVHRRLIGNPASSIQDRSVYEDAEIFARNLYQQGLINARDYKTYWDLYQVLTEFLPPPDLIVYLRASVPTLLDRIARRGREYERTISAAYLARLNALYEAWSDEFSLCPILKIPTDKLNFASRLDHLDWVAQEVGNKLDDLAGEISGGNVAYSTSSRVSDE